MKKRTMNKVEKNLAGFVPALVLTTASVLTASGAMAQASGGGAGPAGPGVGPSAGQAAPAGGQANQAGQAGQTGQANQTGQSNGASPAGGQGSAVSSGQTGGRAASNSSLPGTNPVPDSPNFDLARTIQSAIGSSASLIQARRDVEIDRKRADEFASENRPKIDGNGSVTRFDQATTLAFAGQKIEFIGNHTEDFSASATENLDLLGIVRAQTSQAKLQALADTFTVTTLQNQRILQAQTAYFELLRSIHNVQVAETALRNSQEQQAVADKLYQGQIGQKIDLLRANTQVAQAQQNLTAAQNNRDITRASFNDLVGRPLSAPVVVQDVPGVTVGIDIPTTVGKPGAIAPTAVDPNAPTATVQPAAGTPPAGGAGAPPALVPIGSDSAALGFAPYAAPTAEVTSINLDQEITAAQGRRPEVLQAATLQRASDVGVRVARSGLQPTFGLSAAYNYYPTTSFQFPRQRTGTFVFTVSLPLYDGGRTRDKISEAKLQTQNAQTTLDSTKEDVTLQVRESYLNLSTAVRQIDAANSALQQAIAARQLAQVRYEGQVGLYLEVTDAQSALVQAESAQVDAVYNYLIARAQFQNVLGTPQTGNSAPLTGSPTATAPLPNSTTTPAVTPPTQP